MKIRQVLPSYHRTHTRSAAWALLPSLALILAACGNSTGPETPTVYDLEVSLNTIRIYDNCEDAAGNPGEWNWQALVRVAPQGAVVTTGTSGYPSSRSVLSWHDGELYEPNRTLVLRGITEVQRDSITISLAGTEWDFDTDPPTMDPDMSNVQQTNRLDRGGVVGLTTGPRCAIRLGYSFDWIEQ